jgi:hypothetical protein
VANRTAFGLSDQEVTYLRGLFKKCCYWLLCWFI